MAAVTYIAKRRLITGHTASTQYTIDVDLAEVLPGDVVNAVTHVALGGATETNFNRLDETFNCLTVPLNNTERDAVREFLASAIDGQYITFDAFGSIASPDDPKTGVLTSQSHAPSRLGSIDLWTYQFAIRIIE
jgi:hypothetical protein